MDWVVDTCVLLDILDEILPFAVVAAEALDEKAEEGEWTLYPNLTIFNPVSSAS